MAISSKFLRNEDGSSTIEVVLWLPVVLALLFFTIDVSMIYHSKAEISKIAHDTNRGIAVGRFANALEAETYAMSRLSPISSNATVAVLADTNNVSTAVQVPSRDIALMRSVSAFGVGDINVSYSHMMQE